MNRSRAAALTTVVMIGGGCSQEESGLSPQAEGLALRSQATVLVDEKLAWWYHERLAIVWAEEPATSCAGVRLDFQPSEFSVIAAPDQAEQAWDAGSVETGIEALDQRFRAYGVASLSRGEDGGPFRVTLDGIANTPNLVAELEERVDGLDAEVYEGPLTDTGDTRLEERADGWEVTAQVGWGDCQSGCVSRHTWVFEVSEELAGARLLEEAGDELPEELRKGCR